MRRTEGATWTEMIAGFAIIAVFGATILPYAIARAMNEPPTCQNNLKQWGLVFKMFANESRGSYYPQLANHEPYGGEALAFFPAGGQLYPEYVADLSITACPGRAGVEEIAEEYWRCPDGRWCDGGAIEPAKIGWDLDHYFYLSRPISDDAGYVAVRTLLSQAGNDGAFGKSMEVLRGGGGLEFQPSLPDNLIQEISEVLESAGVPENERPNLDDHTVWTGGFELREGIERFFITDINNPAAGAVAQSSIAIMWDTLPGIPYGEPGADAAFPHEGRGAYALFMDGHVELRPFPQPGFPISRLHAAVDGVL